MPPQLHVFVRDWLSSNNILLKSRDGHVLIDSGYTTHAPLMLALLASERGLGGDPLALVANTHCHSDHVGGNAAIVRRYGCPIAVPEAEAPFVRRWDGKALLHDYCDHRVDRFGVDRELAAGSRHVWGDLEWQALAAPGHDMSALVFYNAEHKILISGDALWENGFGFVMPPEVDPEALPATRATIEMLTGLDVSVVIPGHGEPFTAVAAAIERARLRLDSFARDSLRIARHALKVNLMFTLLERQRMALADLPAYVERVGLYR
ncbi:MAG TPA: MBL fold metallo-hydrolase, partial [Casimicrobiaceae bacterium]|nr:MBL fold metallo-hydrolase [Casimicrobiaceae bacterium]